MEKLYAKGSGTRQLSTLLDSVERCESCPGRTLCALAALPAKNRTEFHSIAQMKLYGRGVSVFRQGSAADGVFLVCAGWMKLFYLSKDGRAATVALAGAGTIVGLREVLTNRPYCVNADVLENIELAYVDRARFLCFLKDHPQLAIPLLVLLSCEGENLLAEFCETASKLPSVERLLHALQNLAGTAGRSEEEGTKIRLPLTIQDLADRIGCSRQWTSKLLSELEDRGLIVRHHGWVTLTFEALAAGGTPPVASRRDSGRVSTA